MKGLAPHVAMAVTKLAKTLETRRIPYAIVGGVACNLLGHERTTVDVNVLVMKDRLPQFVDALDGHGYVRRYPGAVRSWRDVTNVVNIDVLVSGEFPGDGRPKAVCFPPVENSLSVIKIDPKVNKADITSINTLSLPALIELKCASVLTAPDRAKDAGDVLALIEIHQLPLEFVQELDVSVRPKFAELWHTLQDARRSGRV